MAIPKNIVPPPRRGARPTRRAGAHDQGIARQRQRGQAKRVAIARALQEQGR